MPKTFDGLTEEQWRKTFQEHLRELDKDRLIADYHYRIHKQVVEAYLNVDGSELADLTLKDIYARTEEKNFKVR